MSLNPGDKVWVKGSCVGPWDLIAVHGMQAWVSRGGRGMLANLVDCEQAGEIVLRAGVKARHLPACFDKKNPEDSEGTICAVFEWMNTNFAVMGAASLPGHGLVFGHADEFRPIGAI